MTEGWSVQAHWFRANFAADESATDFLRIEEF